MTHIMLDLETWGTCAGCDLRSIGAVVFDPYTGWVPDPTVPLAMVNDRPIEPRFYVATSGGEQYGLIRDSSTAKWWSEQSPEAQAAFTDPVDLRDALLQFTDWFDIATVSSKIDQPQHRSHVKIWAHGSHFDVPILEAAYHAVDLPMPWHYRSPRDTRTIFDAAGIDDHSGWLDMFSTGTHHHALDDAICQARAVCAAFKVLRI